MIKLINRPEGELPSKLHLGCGSNFLKDYVNIDTQIGSIQDKDCWIFEGEIKSPQDFPSNWFTEIKAEMVMEHIHYGLIPNLLYCLNGMMAEGGKLEIIVPNFIELSRALLEAENQKSELDIDELRIIQEVTNEFLMPCLSDESRMGHQSIWTPKMANHWLNAEGFEIVNTSELGENRFHLKIEAVKPKGNNYASPV